MRRRFFNNNIKNFDINDYLTIEALEDNLQVCFSNEDLMYGIDGLGWQKLIAGQYSPPINAGQTISFKGNVNSTAVNIKSFIITKRCNLLGNCMSLTLNDVPQFYKLFVDCTTIVHISKDFLPATTLAYSCYEYMFRDCTSLTTAPELPATTLKDYCYDSMFYGCIRLTTAPELPATTLASYCYGHMFYGCTSLTTAPELPATKLIDRCYNGMFRNCTNLNYIKMLATDISASKCLYNWVNNVASTGTFVKNSDMTSLPTATSSNNYEGIPSGWTVVNDGEESGSNLITFTIDGTEHQAEEGMTWGEWVDSEYKAEKVGLDGEYIYVNWHILVIENVISSDVIIPNYAYVTTSLEGAA